jgi:type II secretory pathway pseudopilin PulG
MRQNNQKGFSILETVVVIFITTILLLTFYSLFDWHGKVYNYQQAIIRTSGSARDSMQYLSVYTSQSYRVLTSGAGYNSGPDTLVLQLPAVDNSGEIIASKWDIAVFYASGTQLRLLTMPDPASSRPTLDKQLSDSLQSLVFTYNNAVFDSTTKVTADLTTSLNVRNQTAKTKLSESLYLKNYY